LKTLGIFLLLSFAVYADGPEPLSAKRVAIYHKRSQVLTKKYPDLLPFIKTLRRCFKEGKNCQNKVITKEVHIDKMLTENNKHKDILKKVSGLISRQDIKIYHGFDGENKGKIWLGEDPYPLYIFIARVKGKWKVTRVEWWYC
jgi:hypothetical protein